MYGEREEEGKWWVGIKNIECGEMGVKFGFVDDCSSPIHMCKHQSFHMPTHYLYPLARHDPTKSLPHHIPIPIFMYLSLTHL